MKTRLLPVLATAATALLLPPTAGTRVFAQAARTAQAPAPPALPPEGYTYNPEGRRDPFLSLVRHRTVASDTTGARRGEGLPGLSTNEVTLKGTMVSHGQYVALVQGADSKTYIVHANEVLSDGVVRAITATSMTIRQRVNDPLSLEKQRDVRKLLRPTDDVK